MPGRRVACRCLSVAILALALPPPLHAREDSAYHGAVQNVLKLLPKRPAQVVIVDPNQAAGDVRSILLEIDAFVTKGGRVVYVSTNSPSLQGALKGWALHEHILATIIWHEMAHIDGANEIEAQRREEALWTEFVMLERVDRGDGMRYLEMLRARRRQDGTLRQPHEAWTLSEPLAASAIAVIRPGQISRDR
jgi:hypothetical protein